MAQFNTYENALELFRSVNCVGSFNNIFIAYKNTSAGPGSAFGAIGGMVQAMADSQSQNIFKNTDGFLFNQTDMGIGVFALKATKALLTYSPDKFEPDMSKFFFIRYEDIQALEVKNFNIFNKKIQAINIYLKNGVKGNLMAPVSDKHLPYQQQCFANFCANYKKKK